MLCGSKTRRKVSLTEAMTAACRLFLPITVTGRPGLKVSTAGTSLEKLRLARLRLMNWRKGTSESRDSTFG